MIKSRLIKRLAENFPHLYYKDAEAAYGVVFGTIAEALRDSERVELRNFGAFSVRERAARKGRNPRTGEDVSVGAKSVPYFRVGKELQARVNRGNAEDEARPEPLPKAAE